MSKCKEPIKILKPYKVFRQMNESMADERESIEFISKIIKGVSTDNQYYVSGNAVKKPKDIITQPQKIADQFIGVQNDIGLEEHNRGKRIYPMIYKFDKVEHAVSVQEVMDMQRELLEQYPDFQGVAVAVEDETSIHAGIVFNNYSVNGDKMTKQFKPYKMSNIYNKYIRCREYE